MALTKIKVRFEGNHCAKCNREVKVGWDAYFENVGGVKELYCKPCGDPMFQKQERESEKPETSLSESSKIIEDIISRLILINELYPLLDVRIRDMQESLKAFEFDTKAQLEKLIKAIPKPDKK